MRPDTLDQGAKTEACSLTNSLELEVLSVSSAVMNLVPGRCVPVTYLTKVMMLVTESSPSVIHFSYGHSRYASKALWTEMSRSCKTFVVPPGLITGMEFKLLIVALTF